MRARRLTFLLPGLLPVTLVAVAALLLGRLAPVLGAPVLAILLGLVVRQLAGSRADWFPGVAFASKRILQAAIVALGAGMSLQQVWRIGGDGLPVMLGTLAVVLAAGGVVGRRLGVEEQTRKLVTYGTAICGASAIATMSAVLGASGTAVAFSITVIVVYNVLGAVLFPPLGHLLGMGQESFGLWAGTAINDTSSVVAAATVYGAAAASYAVVVKLTRTLTIIPLAVAESARRRRRQGGGESARAWWRLVPPFLVLFLVAAAIRSTGAIPDAWTGPIRTAALVGTTLAMAGVGLSSSFTELRRAGWRPVALGGILWALVATSSLALQWLTGTL